MTTSRALKRSWWLLAVYGVISILFGINAIFWPVYTAVAMAWAFGFVALAEGCAGIFALFRNDTHVSKGWLLFYSAASMLFGLMAVTQPVAVSGVLYLCLAVWLLAAGVYRIIFAIEVRKQITNEWMIITSGVLGILLALLLLAYPLSGLLSVTVWIGAGAIVYGAFQIIAAGRLRQLPF